jgi:hypothetical protein
MFGKNKINFWLDMTIFIAFAATAITGLLLWLIIPNGQGSGWFVFWGLTRREWVNLHNWAGLAMLMGVIIHLVLHWQWILCIIQRFFGKLAQQARINFSLDSLLFVAFFLTGLSGLVAWLVLPSGGYQGGRNPFFKATLLGLFRSEWNDLHLWAGLAMMAIVTIHLALHWQWIICTVRRYAQVARCQPNECTVPLET